MKGIILSGGSGTRLGLLTKITSKQLLPVYDKPMIFYPLRTLLSGGIKDILIIVAPDHAGEYLKLLGSGKEFGAKFTYEIQDRPEGLPQAFIIGQTFIDNDNVALILGDNIFEDDFTDVIKNFKSGGHIFAKKVHDPERFGVVKLDDNGNALEIREKSDKFFSEFAIPGLYLYDSNVVTASKSLKPSTRGELEIVDIHNWYLKRNQLKVTEIKGHWIDAGTYESLYKANELMRDLALHGKKLTE